MKKVYVTINETNPPSVYKFKVASTTKGSNFREYVAREIVSLIDVEFFFAIIEKGKEPELLDETRPFSQISEAKRIRLRLIIRHQALKIRIDLNEYKTFDFDLKETIGWNLSRMKLDNPELFVLSFKKKSEIFHKVCSNSLQLTLHKWKGEQLTLHRRMLSSEFANTSQENIRNLYQYIQLQINENLVFFSKKNWGIAAGYNYLLEDKIEDEIRKTSFTKYLPSAISFPDSMLTSAKETINDNNKLTPQQAAVKYIEHFGRAAVSCCHSEQVKFLLIDDKWHMQSTRILHVSLQKIVITKSIDDDILVYELITDIVSTDVEGDNLMIKYKNGISWKIKSDQTTILHNVIKDVIEFNNKLDPQATQIISRSIDDIPGLILDKDISTVSLTSQASSKPPSDSSDIEYSQSSDDEDILIQNYVVRAPIKTNMAIPGISQIISPLPSEDPTAPYSVDNQLYRNLNIIKPLSIPELSSSMSAENVPDLSNIIDSVSTHTEIKSQYIKITLIAICITIIIILIKNS